MAPVAHVSSFEIDSRMTVKDEKGKALCNVAFVESAPAARGAVLKYGHGGDEVHLDASYGPTPCANPDVDVQKLEK